MEAGVRPVSAQQSESFEVGTRARADSTAIADSLERKSPELAFGYSWVGTLVLVPAYGVGLFVGPSFGQFYAENYGQALLGIGVRAGGLALIRSGFELFDPSTEDNMKVVGGALLIVGSAVINILTAGNAARSYNEGLLSDVCVTPTANPRSGEVGLTVTVQL